MSADIIMPKVGGYDVENAKLVRWLKREGEAVQAGEPLAEIESEKATLELPSPATGVVLRILIAEGVEAPVGARLAVVGRAGEGAAAAAPVAAQAASEAGEGEERLKVSPLARKLATKWQIDLKHVAGTGPDGRITGEDVERAHEQQRAALPPAAAPAPGQTPAPTAPRSGEVTREPLSKSRASA